MISVVKLTLNDHAVTLDLDLLRIGNNRDSQMLGNLRSNLSGISVNRLTARDDQVIFQIADCPCQCL